MRKLVGISQKIKRAWLDAVLDRLVKTTDETELRTFLDKHLKGELPGKESRAKSIGIVLRIWSGIPLERVALRDRAVALLPSISGQERIWLHWGMTALAYPFFRDTAEVVGRLLSLQDDFTTAQVQGRMVSAWGDRATSKEAAQKLLNTLVDWEVLRSTKTKGHFLLARKMTACTPTLQLWLLETLLGANTADEIEAQQLLRLPELFPFALSIGVADLRKHEGFNIHRQGLDMDMVALRKVRVEQPPRPAKKPRKSKPKPSAQIVTSLFDQQLEEIVSNNGQPHTTPEMTVIEAEREPHLEGIKEQRRVAEDAILESPYEPPPHILQIRELTFVPDNPFAATSAECAKQFRDGHYYGCLALTQAVMEALIQHIWQVKFSKKKSQVGDFLTQIKTLNMKGLVQTELKTKLDQMWASRHTFHHLRLSLGKDQLTLEEMARCNLQLLEELEKEFFGYAIRDGIIIPNRPEFWSIKECETPIV